MQLLLIRTQKVRLCCVFPLPQSDVATHADMLNQGGTKRSMKEQVILFLAKHSGIIKPNYHSSFPHFPSLLLEFPSAPGIRNTWQAA